MILPFTLKRPLTCADLETTGKNPRTARIVEIAITQLHPDGATVQWWSLINPGISIPPETTAIHGITDDHVLGKPRFCEVASRVVRAFRNCDFAGFGVRYDLEVLAEEFKRAGIDTSVPEGVQPPRILDGHRLWQLVSPRTLSDFVEWFAGRKHEGAHGAGADVAGTLDGIEGLFQRHPDLPRDLDKLHELQFPRPENAVDSTGKLVWIDGGMRVALSFGKHALRPITEVPPDYLRWLLNTSLPSDTRTLLDGILAGRVPRKEPQ